MAVFWLAPILRYGDGQATRAADSGGQTSPPVAVGASTNPPAKSLWGTLGRWFSKDTNTIAASPNGAGNKASSPLSVSDLSADQITRGLKEALAQGLNRAVTQLGTEGGFLTNSSVRIPIPEKLQSVEKLLRRTGQEKLADDFVATLNHAAEKAVPLSAGVLAESLKQMTVEDARGILQGTNDAATAYFRRTASTQLEEKFRPIVAEATAQTGVTAAYKNVMERASFASAFFSPSKIAARVA